MRKEHSTTKSRKGMGLWIRQVATWVMIGLKHTFPYVVLATMFYVIVFFPNAVFDCKETEIRWLGLIFQIIGILVVLWQLDGRLKLFRKPTFFSRIGNFWRHFPSRHSKNIGLSAHFSSLGVLAGSAKLRVGRKSNSSFASRIEALEGEIDDLRKGIKVVEKNLNRHTEDNRNSLKAIREENRKQHASLERLVDEAIVGGIQLEWVGIWYLLVGIVLATIAPEIASFNGYGAQCIQ